MPCNVCASAREVNLLSAKVQTKVIIQELPEFGIVAEDFLTELPASELSPCSVSQQFIVTSLTRASGDPCCREKKKQKLLLNLLPRCRYWPSLSSTGGAGNTAEKGENRSSSLEDGAIAINLKSFGAILGAGFLSFQAVL